MSTFNMSTLRIFIVWLLIVPPGFVYVYLNYVPQEINWLNLFIFAVLGILSIYFPIKRSGSPVFLVMWVTVPAFLMYGLLIEIIIMQLSILAMLFNFKSPLTMRNRFFFNSTLFFLLSIASAYVFNLVGGEIGSMEFWPILFAAFCYQLVHTVLNTIGIKLYSNLIKIKTPYFSKNLLVNYSFVLVILPFSLTLYFLIEYIGFSAFFLLGLPFLFMTFIFRLYNNSEKINNNLQQAGEIGHRLSNNLTEEKVINQFVMKVSDMFNAEFCYLFDYNEGWLELIRSREKGKFIDIIFNRLSPGQGIAGSVLKENKPVFYGKRDEWLNLSKDYSPDEMQSVLCLPISRNQNIEAVLLLSTQKQNAFEEYQLKILDILCSYFTVSVEKARNVEETVNKSERCALTKLYNYNFLDEQLDYEMDRLNNGQIDNLSVLMLDIDHFKKVNDTYGHQSGNDILRALAKILIEIVPENGIVGRYGGEEFVYLLTGMSKDKAITFAEEVRSKVEKSRFQIFPDLGDNRSEINVYITISIGVSTAPEDTDEAKSLLRNADRSLYLGAKQAGRNRVAGYLK